MPGRGHGGHGRHGRRRGRRGIQLLEPVLLLTLHHGPGHGYALMERLEKFQLDDVPMVKVYRRLRQMEETGWVASTWDEEASLGPPRRVYHLTADGDAALAAWIADLDAVRDQIALIHEIYDRHLAEGRRRFHDQETED